MGHRFLHLYFLLFESLVVDYLISSLCGLTKFLPFSRIPSFFSEVRLASLIIRVPFGTEVNVLHPVDTFVSLLLFSFKKIYSKPGRRYVTGPVSRRSTVDYPVSLHVRRTVRGGLTLLV